jgi:TRAP transporter TAXI family solute receptor|tara:strand:+ start:2084 stop:3109 length:1026 start_codon:yes stop_codon:yes gene_type:complete
MESHLRHTVQQSWLTVIYCCFVILLVTACKPQDTGRQAGATRWISVATGGTGGVYYPYGGGIAKVISDNLNGVEATAEVTAGTVDNLKFIANRSADIAFALADSVDDAARNRGAFSDFGTVPMRALAVLYDNYNHLVSLASNGIETVADLRGRVISTGAPGSGTEVSAFRILQASGLDPEMDIRKQSLGVAQSVDALKDNKIDAFFFSGGIPTGAVLDLASTVGRTIKVIPNGETLATLQEQYGSLVYHSLSIPVSTYPGMNNLVNVVAVSNILVVHPAMDETLAYAITRILFEQRDELANIHPMAELLTLETATGGSPIPFHDGAIRYYREHEAWVNPQQ